ncbi:putative disease resistance RPP13-like protein 1 isoform X2 [Carya illinoinensis]|uniref:Disease resistance RPP13-like protein 1 n=1 Tax=Carya illinoinensis TaxID=32201 RepID=A0A8T1N5B7_CARIL|nr:putative disease resistance RPP13-like protein 1 isoform X2 [Carya illinoinensis]KAG6625081.1 hypothetical protein CIPAW_16G071100 [Carya illinoinensis]
MEVKELFLSSVIETLLEQLVFPRLLDFARRGGLLENLNKWRKTFTRILAVLDDAEEKQHTLRVVKMWLDDVRDLAYDLEDILDEFTTEALMNENQASSSKVRKLIHGCVTRFIINTRLQSRIKEITERFNDLMARESELNFRQNVDRSSHRIRGTLVLTSLVNEAHVYGREKDKQAILDLLMSAETENAELSVIPIFGMGGIGKTTLAQLVYNDEKMQSFFDLKAWAYVSEEFDAIKVTKTILKSVTSTSCDDDDLNLLQVKLKEKLKGKKFLVILDDIWNENYHDWSILRAPFEVGAPGSRIVITTRNRGVSSMMGTIQAYCLHVLSNDACLSIFTRHAFGAGDFITHPNLKDIGEKIVIRCKGLPLAAKSFGGLLRFKENPGEWKEVLNKNIWDIPKERSGIVPTLMFSYYHLPAHLKRCFAYCSIFPKDYEFKEQQLVLLWMAEGLIQPQEGEKEMEDLVAGDIFFRMEERFGVSKQRKIYKMARHSSQQGGGTKQFEAFSELTCLRTFIAFKLPQSAGCLAPEDPLQLLSKLQCLRVLSLSGYGIYKLPNSIGDLRHLRYLDLSDTPITSMPESITTLYNLQTLILEQCPYLKKLPSTFENLVNLRHLNILNTFSLEEMPPQISKLTCLRTLSHLVVGETSCSGVKELRPLLHLQGTLCISRLENVIEPRDARDAKLIEKSGLDGLLLEWSDNLNESKDRTSELDILSMLHPGGTLKELIIRCYGGARFPSWLRYSSFPNMVLLRIENCKKCTSLPPIGQLPSLKDLSIEGMDSVKNIGAEFYGENCHQTFRSLVTLYFKGMGEWENWISYGEFPHLQKLFIGDCPKLLGKLPNHLPLLEKVVIYGCWQLVVSISSFPELCQVEIERSKGVVRGGKVNFKSLNFMSVSTISEFTSRIKGSDMDGLTMVENLAIFKCKELAHLWTDDVGSLPQLPCLRVLKLEGCTKLVSLVAEKVEEQLQLGMPSMVREIKIQNCIVLESLPKAMMYNNTCLEYIQIVKCDSLLYFAKVQLPPTLKRLEIIHCKNMLVLLNGDNTNCSSNTSLLEYLYIENCPSLKSLTSSGELPVRLKQLSIRYCQKLETIAKRFEHNSFLEIIRISSCESLVSLPTGILSLCHIDEIDICNCATLVCFPEEELLTANLRLLQISGCEKMQALPNCIHRLASLQELQIKACPGILFFPEEGFPINLRSLVISDLNITEALFEWGLHRLTSLSRLVISGGCQHLTSFPEKKLPADSLTNLTIERFPNLETLSSEGFRSLTSLEQLRIEECGKLTSIPEDGLPFSLLKLIIYKCEKLTSFPENGLPLSLQQLSINRCPLLTLQGRNPFDEN